MVFGSCESMPCYGGRVMLVDVQERRTDQMPRSLLPHIHERTSLCRQPQSVANAMRYLVISQTSIRSTKEVKATIFRHRHSPGMYLELIPSWDMIVANP